MTVLLAGSGEMQMIDVNKSIGDGIKVLGGVDLSIKGGSLTSLCGPTGCGKTTLMTLLAGYRMPDSGECLFDGQLVQGPSVDRLVVFQETSLFPWLTLWENILFGPRHQSLNLKEAREKAKELIEISGLQGFESKYPAQLSGGMQRRAELIRALINNPKILLLDEPFRGLDAMTRSIMQEHFMKMFEETRTTMLMITSELEEAIYMGDTVYVLTTPPARVKIEIPVNIPRPREIKHQASETFGELLRLAYENMEEEVQKTFKLLMSKEKVSLESAREIFRSKQ